MKRSIIAAALLASACTSSTSPQTAATPPEPATTARAVESGPCTNGFVEIVLSKPACGIALEQNGSLTIDGRRTAPIIASYEDGATGQTALPARQIILFPPAPGTGLRILQACEGTDASSLCWTARLLDPKTATLHEITAGKYGPAHWIRWSPAETRVALFSRNEGAEWLHVVDTASGVTTTYPDDAENASWKFDRESLAWTSENTFTVKVKACDSCNFETRKIAIDR